MKEIATGLAVILCVGCTVTVKPLHPKQRVVYRHHYIGQNKNRSSVPTSSVVDSQWLSQYHKLEAEHGNYRITDDVKIEATSGGKFRVTPAMLQHFRDLSRAPISPTPAPTPNREFEPN